MSVSSLELQRARKAMEAFCTRRNSLATGLRMQLHCEQDRGHIVVMEIAGSGQAGAGAVPRPLLRITHSEGGWLLFWARNDGSWEPYPHLQWSDSIRGVIDELEQAPLHVHWD